MWDRYSSYMYTLSPTECSCGIRSLWSAKRWCSANFAFGVLPRPTVYVLLRRIKIPVERHQHQNIPETIQCDIVRLIARWCITQFAFFFDVHFWFTLLETGSNSCGSSRTAQQRSTEQSVCSLNLSTAREEELEHVDHPDDVTIKAKRGAVIDNNNTNGITNRSTDTISKLVINLSRTADIDHGTATRKPPYSYAQLIIQAIASTPNQRLTLADIYGYISSKFPFYKPDGKCWQVGLTVFFILFLSRLYFLCVN